MKVLIAAAFFYEFELWKVESLEDAKIYAASMAQGQEAPEPGELIGSHDDILTADAMKEADEIIFIEDYL